MDNLKTQLSASTVAVQGSGWGWLGFNKTTKKLQLAACANQDPLEATTGVCDCVCLSVCLYMLLCGLRGLVCLKVVSLVLMRHAVAWCSFLQFCWALVRFEEFEVMRHDRNGVMKLHGERYHSTQHQPRPGSTLRH